MANIESLLGHQTHLLLSKGKPIIGNFGNKVQSLQKTKTFCRGQKRKQTEENCIIRGDMPIEQASHIMTISVEQIFSEFETGDRKENDSLLGPFQL